jgi:hypothetical protein
LEPTLQQKELVWDRQKAMCGRCGKKHESTLDNADCTYFGINETIDHHDDLILLCKQCTQTMANQSKNPIFLPDQKYNFHFANFENYSSDNILSDFKSDVDKLTELVKNATEWRAAETKVKEFKIKNYNFIKDKTIQDEYSAHLDSLLKDIKAKYSEEHQKMESLWEENYQTVKSKLIPAEEIVKTATDFKSARESLIAIQNEIKGLSLKRENKEEVILTFNRFFEELNKRQTSERESYEMECIENYHNIKGKIDSALNKIASATDFKSSREMLIAVQGEFKGLKLRKDQRDEQYSRIQAAFEDLNTRQSAEREKFSAETAENYDSLKNEVNDAVEFSKTSPSYKQAREVLIALQGKIKETRLTREQRDEFFTTVRAAFDDINSRQETERGSYDKECEDNYNMLKTNVTGAVDFAATATNFKEARESLIAVQSSIKGVTLKKEQREELYQIIRDNFESLNNRQNEERSLWEKESAENYDVLKNKITKIIEEMTDAIPFRQTRETLIAVQNEVKILKLKKDQRDELFADLRTGFEKYDTIRNQYSEQMKVDKVDKLRSILFNLEAKIPRIEELMARDKDSLEYQQFKLNEVRTGDKEEEIKKEIQEKIDAIQQRIDERAASLTETTTRIEQLKKEIEEAL